MELAQRSTISAQATGPRSRRVSTAALVAILTVVAVSEAFIIGTLSRARLTARSIGEHAATVAADPLHAPSMAEFRAEERATGVGRAGPAPARPSMADVLGRGASMRRPWRPTRS